MITSIAMLVATTGTLFYALTDFWKGLWRRSTEEETERNPGSIPRRVVRRRRTNRPRDELDDDERPEWNSKPGWNPKGQHSFESITEYGERFTAEWRHYQSAHPDATEEQQKVTPKFINGMKGRRSLLPKGASKLNLEEIAAATARIDQYAILLEERVHFEQLMVDLKVNYHSY